MNKEIAAILSLDVVGFSQMMEVDAKGTLSTLNRLLRNVVRPAIKAGHGTVIKLMGDSVLAKFSSAADAIEVAARIQADMLNETIRLRAGCHVGDITTSGTDIFGDAVNIATRLQTAARPGNGLVSRLATELAGGSLPSDISLKPEGALRLKGIHDPVDALSFVMETDRHRVPATDLKANQDIRFTTSEDGVRLAWTSTGDGPVLVKAPSWIAHLELDWSNINAGWMIDLSQDNRLVRFDQRGNGLSDRDAEDISLQRFVEDLKAVFDAADIDRAPLFCKSQGAAIGAAFAVQYPEKVTGLIAIGAFRQGPLVRSEPRHVELTSAIDAMARVGWDDDFPSIRDHFASVLAPDAASSDQRTYASAMQETISAEAFARFRESVGRFDVTDLLPQVRCPALVLHATGDRLHSIEQGRSFAAAIPDSRFVALPSRNHVMPSYDAAWPLALREIRRFLGKLNS